MSWPAVAREGPPLTMARVVRVGLTVPPATAAGGVGGGVAGGVAAGGVPGGVVGGVVGGATGGVTGVTGGTTGGMTGQITFVVRVAVLLSGFASGSPRSTGLGAAGSSLSFAEFEERGFVRWVARECEVLLVPPLVPELSPPEDELGPDDEDGPGPGDEDDDAEEDEELEWLSPLSGGGGGGTITTTEFSETLTVSTKSLHAVAVWVTGVLFGRPYCHCSPASRIWLVLVSPRMFPAASRSATRSTTAPAIVSVTGPI